VPILCQQHHLTDVVETTRTIRIYEQAVMVANAGRYDNARVPRHFALQLISINHRLAHHYSTAMIEFAPAQSAPHQQSNTEPGHGDLRGDSLHLLPDHSDPAV
jgi:hypothetical protein